MGATDSLCLSKAAQWESYYNLVEQQLGATATIINFGDQKNFGKVDATTGTGMKFSATGLSPTWTWSKAPSTFDTPFDLTLPSNWLGLAPILTLDGVDEEADTPDNAFWTRDDTSSQKFSICMWINVADATNSVLLSKFDATGTLREWSLELDASDQLAAICYDESVTAFISTTDDAALIERIWVHVVVTYSGSTGPAGIDIYRDGALVASTDADDQGGTYVGMEDTATVVALGYKNATKTNFLDGKVLGGPWGPSFSQVELTAEQVANLYARQRLGLGV